MSATLTIACPDCSKQLKVRAELEGKKVRCKSCGHTFTVQAPKAPAPKKAGPQPPKPGRKVVDESEYDDPNPYDVTTLDLTPRCPHCATEFESEEAIVCISCGYNRQTRAHIKTVRTIGNTGGEKFLWLLPGIACALTVLALIGLIVFWCVWLPDIVGEDSLGCLASTAITLWVVVIALFGIFFAGKYAVKRLILNPIAPEKKKGS